MAFGRRHSLLARPSSCGVFCRGMLWALQRLSSENLDEFNEVVSTWLPIECE